MLPNLYKFWPVTAGEVLNFPGRSANDNALDDIDDLTDAEVDLHKTSQKLRNKFIKREIDYVLAAVNYHQALAIEAMAIAKRLKRKKSPTAERILKIAKEHALLATNIQNKTVIPSFTKEDDL